MNITIRVQVAEEQVKSKFKDDAERMVVLQGERIRDIRKAKRMTVEKLAELTGLHSNTVGRIERGIREADTEQLLAIAAGLGITPGDLAIFSTTTKPASDSDEFAYVDMLDIKVSAGAGSNNEHQDVIGKFAFKRSWLARRGIAPEQAKIIRARGDSMADRINDGDILMMDTAVQSLVQDGVYVIELDGLDYVKLLQRDFSNGGIRVISYNPAWPPQVLNADMAANLRISGRVIWHAGEL